MRFLYPSILGATLALLVTNAWALSIQNVKDHPCPPDHVSGCQYIIMMHALDSPIQGDSHDVVAIASTPADPFFAGRGRRGIDAEKCRGSISKTLPSPNRDPTWFQVLAPFHDYANTRPGALTSNSVGDLVWYSTTMHPSTAALLQQQQEMHRIKYLIPDLPVQLFGHVQKHPPSWGLDRIDQRNDKLDGQFHYPESAGENVTIYIIDTGVNIDHKDFGGRAKHGPVFLPGSRETADVNGHGTFVAALAAGSTYGVAKKAQIVSLKTLDNSGAGRLSNVLAAIEWVVNRHLSQGKDARSIINLSLGAEHNEPTNQAIQEAMRLGIHFSIAAGNDGKDACQFSPASTPGALTVGATDEDDTIASYSNSGPCVAIYAPGSNIVSAWAGSNSATHTQSGTSMASPHVAGLIALLLSESPEENIPVKKMSDRILKTVTRFSLHGKLVEDTVATSMAMSLVSSDPISVSNDDQVMQSQPELQVFHGKALARNLIFVGAAYREERETEIETEDIFQDYSTASSTVPLRVAMTKLILTVACAFLFTIG